MEQDNIFRPQRHFCGGPLISESNSFVPIYFSFLSRNNTIPWIHFSFFLLCCCFLLLGLGNRAFSSSTQRGKSYTRWRLTGFYSFPFFFSFFFFLMWRNWDEKRKCNGLPALNSYPVASYISEAATSVPFKWPLLFYFVHIRYKLWWMLYRLQILQRHLATNSQGLLRLEKLRWSVIVIH